MPRQRALALINMHDDEDGNNTFFKHCLSIWRQTQLSDTLAGTENNRVPRALNVHIAPSPVSLDYGNQGPALGDCDLRRFFDGGRHMRAAAKLLSIDIFCPDPNPIEAVVS